MVGNALSTSRGKTAEAVTRAAANTVASNNHKGVTKGNDIHIHKHDKDYGIDTDR